MLGQQVRDSLRARLGLTRGLGALVLDAAGQGLLPVQIDERALLRDRRARVARDLARLDPLPPTSCRHVMSARRSECGPTAEESWHVVKFGRCRYAADSFA